MNTPASNSSAHSGKKTALFHVGLAKCASTYFGDQMHKAAQDGRLIAAYWAPWDNLINQCYAEVIGSDVIAFPQHSDGNFTAMRDRHFVASNECLTGHFPQPLRATSFPAFSDVHMRAAQETIAKRLHALTQSTFQDFNVRILMITRSPDSWLRSLYKNLVLMGVPNTPETYFQVFGKVLAQWSNLDFLSRTYRGLFGAQNVLMIPFELLRDDFERFAATVNGFAGVEILLDNEARNYGLSDGATEYFRRLWESIDAIAPPEPSWAHPSVVYKQLTWEFLHNTVLNDGMRVTQANARFDIGPFEYEMPSEIIGRLRSHMSCLRNEAGYADYLDEYLGSP